MQYALSLDHFFLITAPGAPEAALLLQLGLVEGSRNNHAGQGTANRRFFFPNSMLELLYVRDADEASNGPARRLNIVERARTARASPVGLILKSSDASSEPFPGWRYYPNYFGPDRYFHVGANSDLLEEPLCIFVPFEVPRRVDEPLSFAPFTTITEVCIRVPVNRPSPILETVGRVDGIRVVLGAVHRIDVVFQHGKFGRSKDLRPALPLVLCW